MKQQYFVGIGAQKAGTTWLANYLDAHPQVAFSPIKELHFFDAVFLKYFKRSDYKETFLQLKSAIPKENILILFYENMTDETKSANEIQKLCNFLKIDYIQPEPSKKVNISKKIDLETESIKKLVSSLSHVYEFIENELQLKLPKKWHTTKTYKR
jgi:flagellin-specific chaperone FliS